MSAPKLSPQANAGQIAAQIIGRTTQQNQQLANVLANGIPAIPANGANPGSEAVTAADLNAALGSVAVAKLQAQITSWNA